MLVCWPMIVYKPIYRRAKNFKQGESWDDQSGGF